MSIIPSNNKFNTERLKGPKGIETIEKYFNEFKFHGKGHEKYDLDRIMKRLEHWCYRLYPNYQFDDCLEKIEKLGCKKDLQVYIKKYRLNMITTDDIDTVTEQAVNVEDTAEYIPGNSFENIQTSVPEDIPEIIPTHTLQILSQLTEEDKERIERNRQLAIERRFAKMKDVQEKAKKRKLNEHQDVMSQVKDIDIFANDIQNVSAKERIDLTLQSTNLINSKLLHESDSQVNNVTEDLMDSTSKNINVQEPNCVCSITNTDSNSQTTSQGIVDANFELKMVPIEEKSNIESKLKTMLEENDKILMQSQHVKLGNTNLHSNISRESNAIQSKLENIRIKNNHSLNSETKISLTREELKLEIEAALDEMVTKTYGQEK